MAVLKGTHNDWHGSFEVSSCAMEDGNCTKKKENDLEKRTTEKISSCSGYQKRECTIFEKTKMTEKKKLKN